jgi:hypothetical protein
VMSTSVYIGLNMYKFYSQTLSADLRSESRCALTRVLEVMSTSVYIGLKMYKFYSQTLSADLRSESRCALLNGDVSNVHKHLYRSEPV